MTGEIVNLHVTKEQREEAAFRAYADARQRLDQDFTLDNARAVGQAWHAFLRLYMNEDQRRYLYGRPSSPPSVASFPPSNNVSGRDAE